MIKKCQALKRVNGMDKMILALFSSSVKKVQTTGMFMNEFGKGHGIERFKENC